MYFFNTKNFKTRPGSTFDRTALSIASNTEEENPFDPQPPNKQIERTVDLLRSGEISRAMRCLQSLDSNSTPINEVFKLMQDLHPTPNSDDSLPPLPTDLPKIEIDQSTALKVIKNSAKKSTPCGALSVRNEFLKQLIGSLASSLEEECLDVFTWLFNMIGNGLIPTEIMEVLKDTQGMAIDKKTGGIRPLGLRDSYINLTAKAALIVCKVDIEKIFRKVNYALAGKKKMDELISLMSHSFHTNPNFDRIFIDATNAFNCISRREAFQKSLEVCPILSTLIHALYGSPTKVWLRKDSTDQWSYIEGKTGSVQGCVLGPLIHALSTLNAYNQVARFMECHQNSFMGAYMDDVTLVGKTAVTARGFEIFRKESEKVGTKLNFKKGKTEVMLGVQNNKDDLQRAINKYTDLGFPPENILIHPKNGGDDRAYGYTHLGVPRGSRCYLKSAFDAALDKVEVATNRLSLLENAQDQWALLAWAIKPKFPFLLRHLPPSITHRKIGRINHMLRKCFTKIIGQPMSDRAWEQAGLPTQWVDLAWVTSKKPTSQLSPLTSLKQKQQLWKRYRLLKPTSHSLMRPKPPSKMQWYLPPQDQTT